MRTKTIVAVGFWVAFSAALGAGKDGWSEPRARPEAHPGREPRSMETSDGATRKLLQKMEIENRRAMQRNAQEQHRDEN